MFPRRAIAILAAAVVAGGGLAALGAFTVVPVHAQGERTCLYKVRDVPRGYVKVRRKPGKRPHSWNGKYKTVDVLVSGGATTGECRRSRERWREVEGDGGVTGHVRKRFVEKGPRIAAESSPAPSPARTVPPVPVPAPTPTPTPAPTIAITLFPILP
ncbi:hypothetical protein [Planomonospora algeriensis]